MKLKAPLLAIAFTGTLVLKATFSAAADCSNSPANSSVSNQPASPSQDVAQSPTGSMGGMDHGSMSQSPGMSGMNHGSMNMSLGPKDANFDLRFIDGMSPHHEGASCHGAGGFAEVTATRD